METFVAQGTGEDCRSGLYADGIELSRVLDFGRGVGRKWVKSTSVITFLLSTCTVGPSHAQHSRV